MDASEQAVCNLLMEWKKKPDLLITLEMLKASLRPLVEHQLSKYDFAELGVREVDIKEAAEKLLVDALRTYDESKGSLSNWVLVTLLELDKVVKALQSKYDPQRRNQKAG